MSENKKENTSSRFGAAVRKLWKRITNNWVLKVIALALALLLWGFIYAQDDSLTREKVFENVQVQVGESYLNSLRNRGYIITSGLKDPIYVTVRLETPQRYYDKATADTFTVRPDFSRITHEGTVSIPLIYSGNSNYGTAALSVTEITVEAAQYYSRGNIAVSVMQTGSLSDGYRADDARYAVAEPSRITVSGPKQLVEKIIRAEAQLDISMLEPYAGIQTVHVPLVFRDREGNTVVSDQLSFTVSGQSTVLDGVNVTQNVYHEWTLPVETKGIVTGTPGEGYQIVGVTVEPASVLALSLTENINADRVFVNGEIDVSGKTETLVRRCTFAPYDEIEKTIPQQAVITIEIESENAPAEETAEAAGETAETAETAQDSGTGDGENR